MFVRFEADEPMRAPECKVSTWLNADAPVSLKALQGRVVLLDFWDYSCINCLNTLPLMKRLHEAYAEVGLVVLGIHTPEFAFAADSENVKAAIKRLGVAYPVGLDNARQTWDAYANRAWPTQYVINTKGYIKACNRGEGGAHSLEAIIRELLAEQDADVASKAWVTRPEEDTPQASCRRLTPELYLGFKRGIIANLSTEPSIIAHLLPLSEMQPERIYLGGAWTQQDEYIVSEPDTATQYQLQVGFQAGRVLAVMAAEKPVRIWISVDDNVIGWQNICEPQCYLLWQEKESAAIFQTLRIWTDTPGLRIYTLLFQP